MGAVSPASGAGDSVRVFISYSHDSQAHARRVLVLANRLRADGIDCELDAFEEAPLEGWPAWMARQLREARYVLVVCTASYHRRVTGREHVGVGLGARWEGALITQDLYGRGGQNDKFIPVVVEKSDVAEIPDFLRHTTRYDLSDPEGYRTLYHRLTAQPRIVKRPLGTIRTMPPEKLAKSSRTESRSSRKGSTVKAAGGRSPARPRRTASTAARALPDFIAIMEGGRTRFVSLVRVQVRDVIEAVLRPESSDDRAYLEGLVGNRFSTQRVGVAFGLTGVWARISTVTRTLEGGEDLFFVTLLVDERAQRGTEMSTSGVSVDDIAELRARRILLDERPPSAESKWHASGFDSTLEMLVRGLGTELSVEGSPLPALFRTMGNRDAARFTAAARLVAVLWLRLTGTVEHVLELEMRSKSKASLTVRFRGQRARLYTNREPVEISVEGTCELRRS
ncbi:MAG: SEFIR domain-containing protein [Gemmatimonadaceae bacterium]